MTEALGDGFIISLTCYFPTGYDVPADFTRAAKHTTIRSDGTTAVRIGTLSIEQNDARQRQIAFVGAVTALIDQLETMDAGRTILGSAGAAIALSITLLPFSGFAGLVLTPDLIQRASALGVFIDIEASPSGG